MRRVLGGLAFLAIASALAGRGGASSAAKLESLIRAHPFAFVPDLRGVPAAEIGSPPRVTAVKCTRAGYLAGVGDDFSCDLKFRGVETALCAAPVGRAAILCHSDQGVDCPHYVPPSTRRGATTFELRSEGWALHFVRRFSLYHCVGTGFNTGYVEVGVSNFNAQGGFVGESWTGTRTPPVNGVLLVVGSYEAGVDVAPSPDTRLPLTVRDFRRVPGFRFLTAELWSHGDRSFVHLYIGPRAGRADRAALLAALRSLRVLPPSR